MAITPPPLPGATSTTSATSTTTGARTEGFDIPASIKEKQPELIELILGTKSMNDKEKQYWFHILPVMKEDQVEKLKKILINEKQKLAEIDKKYSQKFAGAQAAQESNWKGEVFKEKLVTIKKAESDAEIAEKTQEDALLNQLNSV